MHAVAGLRPVLRGGNSGTATEFRELRRVRCAFRALIQRCVGDLSSAELTRTRILVLDLSRNASSLCSVGGTLPAFGFAMSRCGLRSLVGARAPQAQHQDKARPDPVACRATTLRITRRMTGSRERIGGEKAESGGL